MLRVFLRARYYTLKTPVHHSVQSQGFVNLRLILKMMQQPEADQMRSYLTDNCYIQSRLSEAQQQPDGQGHPQDLLPETLPHRMCQHLRTGSLQSSEVLVEALYPELLIDLCDNHSSLTKINRL